MDDDLQLVRDAVAAEGSTRVALRIGVGESTVRAWLTGRGKPRAKARDAIRAALAGPTSAVEKGATIPGVPLSAGDHADPKANAIATLAVLRRHLIAAPRDQVTSIANAITSSSRLLARLSGQLEVTQAQVLRSAAWARLQRTILDALDPFPEALRAVADATERIDDEA